MNLPPRLALLFILATLLDACSVPPPDTPAIGYVDHPAASVVAASQITLRGWALDIDGVEKVEMVLENGTRLALDYGIGRKDVAAAHPGYVDSRRPGFELTVDVKRLGGLVSRVAFVVTDRRGNATTIAQRILISTVVRNRWKPLLEARPSLQSNKFYLLFATSNLSAGGASEIATTYEPLVSDTIEVGFRVPILYMRTTRGAAHDWVFDPDFDTRQEHDGRQVAEDALSALLDYAKGQGLPVLITLNGGVWGDARDTVPQWDLNDHLEEDPRNCQWNESNEVMPDSYLRDLPGSEQSPELARALTLNVHADQVRAYKRRNLQQAGRVIARFAEREPDLFVGINLDPDVYVIPFFEGKQWYDYNPDTLRQFREWLAGTGPYSEASPGGALRSYRRARSLSLDELERLTKISLNSWAAVDGPRFFDEDHDRKYWNEPLFQLWVEFRRHLVDLHYDELSDWLSQVGIPSRQLFSSQGFMAPISPHFDPFPVYLSSPAKNYDAGGMSVEGALPRHGHIGAILYGASATNDTPMETDERLFHLFWRLDPDWAVVEHNTADLRKPRTLPSYAAAYRSLREVFNFGARFVAPMAWNGSNGIYRDRPDFVAFTSVRNTPLESAIRDFLISHANIPRGTLLWPFGTYRHDDDDGWRAAEGTVLHGEKGHLRLTPAGDSRTLTLMSPQRQAFRPSSHDLLILGVEKHVLASVRVDYRPKSTSHWRAASATIAVKDLEYSPVGYHVPLTWSPEASVHDLRIVLALRDGTPELSLDHLALYPRG